MNAPVLGVQRSGPRLATAPLRVLAVAADPAATITRIRVGDPLSTFLAGQGGELQLRPLHDVPLPALDWADVLVVQRGTAQRHLALMHKAVARSRAVIYEIDDLLTEPAPHLLHALSLQRDARWVSACLAAADLVTVSTPRLAELLQLPQDRHQVVPNTAFSPGAPAIADRPLPPQRADEPVTVLVASSDRVAGTAAWQALATANRAAQGRLRVLAVGPVAADLALAGVPCEALPLMPREAFVRWASEQRNPLALMPLDDSRFSAGKSAVKWYDYAEAGVPTLASDAGPFRDNLDHGRTGWLVGALPADWQSALDAALADAVGRLRVATAAREHVRQHHRADSMTQAWGIALERALGLAAGRAVQAPATPWLCALRDSADGLGLALRRWNRERLARRK